MDENKASEMIGKYVLVGVSRMGANQQVLSTQEIHGKVMRVSEEDGLIILQQDGTEFELPPLLDCYHEAEEGIYTLKSTKEQVNNPDYVATFNITATEENE